ncbi:hypothetical protein [Paenibacillus sp. FJAT-26967]|uniref:hypothetical protein n=1 Tax=Paenibacillus sp. FJAT-26967 TaxID=1729690 RepID=UPI0008385B73|nr:hypothetical protein [Paenibacillus sp. FJAT-26967]
MSSYCPVCNGMETLTAICPGCSGPAADFGRYNDYLGPYAPYREIEEIGLSNGYPDVLSNRCMHIVGCEGCGQNRVVAIEEIASGEKLI